MSPELLEHWHYDGSYGGDPPSIRDLKEQQQPEPKRRRKRKPNTGKLIKRSERKTGVTSATFD